MLLAAALLLLTAQIQVDPDKVLNSMSDDLYGSCIEDVNHEIYGGLYGQRIFGESFEEPGAIVGPAGWRAFGGDWSSVGDEVNCRAGNGPMLVLEGKTVSDGVVETRVRVGKDQGGSAGFMVRVSNVTTGIDTFDGYEVSFQAKAGILGLSRHRHDYQPLAETPAPIATGDYHLIRVSLEGPRIRVFLDGEPAPRLDFTDRDRPLLSGDIALRPWQADCGFRDIKVLGAPVSLELGKGGLSGMWDPVGHPICSLEGQAFNGAQCQKISNPGSAAPVGIANRGLNRWGIAVTKGRTMDGRVALKGNVKSATVALQSADGSRTYASEDLNVSREWQQRSFHLKPGSTDSNAKFVVLIHEAGSLFVDQAVLMDGDRFHGLPIRGDIARAMVDERLTFLRYAGSMVNAPGYRWKNMIGKPDLRPPYRGLWYPFSTNGFGIFDFLNFCEVAKIRAAFAINIEETAEDAADLADYLTAPISNTWGARRAADGHPNPYHPEYIEIGNEEGIGRSPHSELLHYAERFRALEKAIHGRNPNLKLVCSAWWYHDSPDMRGVFDAVDGLAAAWDIHVSSDEPNAGVEVNRELSEVEDHFHQWNPKTNLKVVVFEENGGLHNQQRALGHATTLNAVRRHGGFVLADCHANCLQPWLQNDNGWDQGQVFFTPNQVWGMPPYYVQQLLSRDREPLHVASVAPADLDVLASRSADGQTVVVTVVNIGSNPISSSIELNRYAIGSAKAVCIAGDLADENSPTAPKRISLTELASKFHGNVAEVTFPAHSVTSLRLRRDKSGWLETEW